nr:retrovirus-related Pol polyprotein from transposon TNT 1-94 [Tanacetum cinerariifolium]
MTIVVTKPHNKTPYELLHGRLPSIGFMRPFGCPVTILNTLDPLGEFQRKVDAEFEECNNNNSYGVNAASSLVSTARHTFINSTNDFSAAGPSNAAASPTAANSLDMPNLEDLTHSNDTDDVGAVADINNLEFIISTRSMARAVRDQGGISHMFNEDFHTCMFAYFLLQEEPKRVYQALKDPSWIEAMQEELLQFKMQKVWILVDLPYGKRAIGFEDPENSNKVYKVVKALYGLHQAPRAWSSGKAKEGWDIYQSR